ncbi:hypothetical protein Ae406Ps2_0181c [Pseudonocardia sp. Ae406_Ps2]|nr:hypothetical protein Ae406Ps2_0181c [Pseudonocardia sp. Ae406_Ps2]OLM13741.1 hypothetical protein Ae505Ps2_3870c [Pseudonocardia sp. Ae505_Ps2]
MSGRARGADHRADRRSPVRRVAGGDGSGRTAAPHP